MLHCFPKLAAKKLCASTSTSNISFTASLVIVAVLPSRLLLKKTPRIFSYALWSEVLFRLLCPISFESMLSLLLVNKNPISINTLYSADPRIHWFNPLVWTAFILAVKDMEMSCGESVMKRLHTDIRGKYSASFLSLATGRKMIAGTPLAFGEGNTKNRIKKCDELQKSRRFGEYSWR